jgi:hypothetical protein
LMLVHCKNIAIHDNINDMCIVMVLSHCKNNVNHCKINDICMVVMLIQYKTPLIIETNQ